MFHKSHTNRGELPFDHHADESDTDRAVQFVAVEADAENEEEDVNSNSSKEDNILNDSGALEHPHTDHLEIDSAVQPAESHGIEIDTDSVAWPGESPPIVDINNEDAQQASETLDDAPKPKLSRKIWISQLSKQQQVLMMIGSIAVRFCSTWISTRTFALLFANLVQNTTRFLM